MTGSFARRPRSVGGPRRIGVMGGTFDPIHHGHLVAASEVADRFGLDEVIFVPTGRPWQKMEVSLAEHRYLMTVIATASNPRFTVSRVDVDRPGPTYTVDTLTDLQKADPGAEWYFITGSDALAAIMSWKNVGDLFALAHFIGVTRPGYSLPELDLLPEAAVTLIEVPALAISSTDCRARVEGGMPVWYLVPDGVVQYIEKHRLYQHSADQHAGDEHSAGQHAGDEHSADQHSADRPPVEQESADQTSAGQHPVDRHGTSTTTVSYPDHRRYTRSFEGAE